MDWHDIGHIVHRFPLNIGWCAAVVEAPDMRVDATGLTGRSWPNAVFILRNIIAYKIDGKKL